MTKALALVAVAVVWVGACGGNVVVDASSKTTSSSSGSTSSLTANGGATVSSTDSVTVQGNSTTAFSSTAGFGGSNSGFGGGMTAVTVEGVGPTTVVGTAVTAGGGGAVGGCSTCNEALHGPFTTVCTGSDRMAYHTLRNCACDPQGCLSSCDSFCSHEGGSAECFSCLGSNCASELMVCLQN